MSSENENFSWWYLFVVGLIVFALISYFVQSDILYGSIKNDHHTLQLDSSYDVPLKVKKISFTVENTCKLFSGLYKDIKYQGELNENLIGEFIIPPKKSRFEHGLTEIYLPYDNLCGIGYPKYSYKVNVDVFAETPDKKEISIHVYG